SINDAANESGVITRLNAGAKTRQQAGLLLTENHDTRHRAGSTDVVGESDARVLHLPLTTLPLKLFHAFVDHAYTARADRVSKGFQSAAGIDRDIAGQRRAPLGGQVATLPLRAEPQILGIGDLGPGKAIMDFGEAHVLWRHTSHGVGLLRRHLCGTKAEVI